MITYEEIKAYYEARQAQATEEGTTPEQHSLLTRFAPVDMMAHALMIIEHLQQVDAVAAAIVDKFDEDVAECCTTCRSEFAEDIEPLIKQLTELRALKG